MNSFELLQDILLNKEEIDVESCKNPFNKRFVKAYQNNFVGRNPLDIAVLIRQILLHENSQRKDNEQAVLILSTEQSWPSKNIFEKVGIECVYGDTEIRLSTSLWKPSWLKNTEQSFIESDTISLYNIRKDINFERHEKDCFLSKLGFITYNSLEQKKAVRNALTLEAGKTLAISLPTGEGKSLVFQLISQVGFYDSRSSGVTVVIVPTVALALDHEKSMQKLLKTDDAFAYLSEDEKRKEDFKRKIKDGSQSIIFTSPEAVYTSLRNSLIEASLSGFIRAMVVDEAHIIDEWGNDFRHEFQVFSGLWRQLLRSAPQGNEFRTIMLSATYTQEAIDIIQDLFTKNSNSFEFYNAAKLRPEIDYWVGSLTDKEMQKERLLESIYYLPRPLIVYATTQKDAEKYFQIIKDSGFESVAILHGGSSTINRSRVVSQWKDESIDIVVGTSAFGMGIDYAHVRSVVHACVPETMNRFYQEVGRGGRDGCYSLSLVLPTTADKEIAKSINQKTIIGNDKGFARWTAMFKQKHAGEESGTYIIDIGAPPQYDRDLESTRHYRWNFQVLNLMARAGLIRLEGVPHKEPYRETPERYILISIQNENHLDELTWNAAIDPIRSKIHFSSSKSLNLMYNFLNEKECPADLLAQLYTINVLDKNYLISKICSHCNLCRSSEKLYQQVAVTGSINKKSLNIEESLLVEYIREYEDRSFARKFSKLIENLLKKGYQNFVFIGDAKENFLDKHEKVKSIFLTKPIYLEEVNDLINIASIKTKLSQNELVIFIGNNIKLTPGFIEHNVKNNILIVPQGLKDPRSSSPMFADVFQGDVININEFIKKV